jgi:NAD+ diphosphatase
MNGLKIALVNIGPSAKADFRPALKAPTTDGPAIWFVFQGNAFLVSVQEDVVSVPRVRDITPLVADLQSREYLGTIDGVPCYCAEAAQGPAPRGFRYSGLRPLFASIGEDYFRIAGRASQIVDWIRTHKFCGACGARMGPKPGERAMECPSCRHMAYPRISPAIIVAVVKEGKLLLAHSARFTKGFSSVLAGFVEAGETLEECVHREVREEAGIEVKNLRYFTSQPWPFPNSLMIAFTAEHASGEIRIDGVEIEEADWYSASALPPNLPSTHSVARKLIDWFKASHDT